MKTALVLSAGGMFGAYQAGAWRSLSKVFRPDLVVGASIGAVNGWAISAHCPPDRLMESWLHLHDFSTYRWRLPRTPWHGVIDSTPVEKMIQQIYTEFKPITEYGVVVTDTLRLRPVLFREPGLSWQHLAASTAMLGLFSEHRIGGRVYSDGGLLCALPLWAAAAMGAQRIIAIDVLTHLPSRTIRALVGTVRAVGRFRPVLPEGLEVIRIAAPAGLGSAKDALYWKRDNAARWIELGERDAEAAIRAGRIPTEVKY